MVEVGVGAVAPVAGAVEDVVVVVEDLPLALEADDDDETLLTIEAALDLVVVVDGNFGGLLLLIIVVVVPFGFVFEMVVDVVVIGRFIPVVVLLKFNSEPLEPPILLVLCW